MTRARISGLVCVLILTVELAPPLSAQQTNKPPQPAAPTAPAPASTATKAATPAPSPAAAPPSPLAEALQLTEPENMRRRSSSTPPSSRRTRTPSQRPLTRM